jgi:uncharacterized protein YbjT (DUF2867 family)
MNRVLVAGATGYLGGHILRELKKQNYYVRAISRSKARLLRQQPDIDEPIEAELTRPETLSDCCETIDVVISAVGITRQKEGFTYMEVDYQANINLLKEAQRSGVKKFVYIFIFNAEKISRLKIVTAKRKFAAALKASGMDYCLINPTGFFSDMGDFLKMAQKGRIYLFGTGKDRMNPISGTDLAKVCVHAISGKEQEIDVGGPEVLLHKQIAVMAFLVLQKPVKISYIPIWLKKLILFLLRIFTPVRVYGPVEFLMTVLTMDMVAPTYGAYKLEDYFRKAAQQKLLD